MTHSPLSYKMCNVIQSFMSTICALSVLILSLQVRVANNKTVYAEKGSTVELPCLCPNCRETNWYFDQKDTAVVLFRQTQHNGIKREKGAWDRLKMLANSSLCFDNVADNDTGRYWCQQDIYYNLVVVTGIKQIVETKRTDIVCYILSCSVSEKYIDHSKVRWWEGKKEFQDGEKKAGASIFKGARTSQLQICMKKETTGDQEGMTTKERRVKCSFPDITGIIFNLTGRTKDCLLVCPNATQCLESGGNGGIWIPLAACVALLLAVILALGVALWRKTRCSQKHEEYLDKVGGGVSKPKHRPHLYENIRTRSETA